LGVAARGAAQISLDYHDEHITPTNEGPADAARLSVDAEGRNHADDWSGAMVFPSDGIPDYTLRPGKRVGVDGTPIFELNPPGPIVFYVSWVDGRGHQRRTPFASGVWRLHWVADGSGSEIALSFLRRRPRRPRCRRSWTETWPLAG
jgi:hypothetical protein